MLLFTQGHLEVVLIVLEIERKVAAWLYSKIVGGHLAIGIATCSAIHGKNASCLRQNDLTHNHWVLIFELVCKFLFHLHQQHMDHTSHLEILPCFPVLL